MSREQIFDRLVTLLARVTPAASNSRAVAEEMDLVYDLRLTSLTLVSVMMLCDEAFGIDVMSAADRLDRLETVGDAVTLVQELMVE